MYKALQKAWQYMHWQEILYFGIQLKAFYSHANTAQARPHKKPTRSKCYPETVALPKLTFLLSLRNLLNPSLDTVSLCILLCMETQQALIKKVKPFTYNCFYMGWYNNDIMLYQ